ncbi:MAG TPA: SRPBCC family protein [Candidatus Dormibacteraeota bacterium]
MKRKTLLRWLAITDTAVSAVLAYRYYLLPRIRNSGATPAEVERPMPGDELVSRPVMEGTHGITIAAPPDAIWPWLVQIGYGRAGFYSYEWIERLMGLPIVNEDRVSPEYSRLAVGDVVPFGPGDDIGLPVIALEPHRFLCLGGAMASGIVTWCFGLYPVDPTHTRLVSRNRAFAPGWTLASILGRPASWRVELPMKIFFDPGSFLMVRKMLLGIKQRAERDAAERKAEEAALVLSSGCE